jgi:ParB family chromosome partitioning protein
MIRTIPLNRLVPSKRNVRRSSEEQADLQLKDDIETRGLLQNLVVTAVKKPRGCFAVEAGGRRLQALQQLAAEGKLAFSHQVCCLVIESGAEAQEASLAENFQRLSMNPADECLAFQQLIEQGSDAEVIARRFGLTTRFVEGRLRLAGLAPVVFDALGAGEISLDVAKAYAATPDRDRQAFLFDQMSRGYGGTHPDSIRRMMTQATVSAADRRARFVGEDAYVAAGGRIERDLFSEDAGARWLDIALLERLASEKMEAVAAETAAEQGFAFVRPTLDSWVGHAQTAGLRRVSLETPPLTDEERARVEVLEGEVEELVDILEHEGADDAAQAEAEARVRLIGEQIDAIVNKPPVIDQELRPKLGAFLILDEEGRPRLSPGLYAEVPEGSASSQPSFEGAPDTLDPDKKVRKSGLSQRLVDELAIQRRDILAVHVAADPSLALDLVIFLMNDGRAGYPSERSGSTLAAPAASSPAFGFETPGAAATLARSAAAEALDRGWMEGATRAERFDAFRLLPDENRAAWLGHAVAQTLEASVHHPGDRNCAFHDHLGQLAGISVADWWRPSGVNYFDRVPKSLALAALREVGGDAFAERYARAKKAELAQLCERIFSGDFIGEVEVKEAAVAWVPPVMRFAPAHHPSSAGGAEEELFASDEEIACSGDGTSVSASRVSVSISEVEEAA